MSNYLRQLIQRSAGSAAAIQPRLGSRFERPPTEPLDMADTRIERYQHRPELPTESLPDELPMTPQPADRLIDAVATPAEHVEVNDRLTDSTSPMPAARQPQVRRRPAMPLKAATSMGDDDETRKFNPLDPPRDADSAPRSSGAATSVQASPGTASPDVADVPVKPDTSRTSTSNTAERNANERRHVVVHPHRPTSLQPSPHGTSSHQQVGSVVEESIPSVRLQTARSTPEPEANERVEIGDQQRHVEPVSANASRREVKHRVGGERAIDTPSETPTVRVTIGRIEILADRNAPPQHQENSASVAPRQPVMSLDDYLRKRAEGGDE